MRDRLAVVFAFLVVVAAVGAGYAYLRYFRGGEDRQAEAEAVVAAFADAWQSQSWEALADLTLASGGDGAGGDEAAAESTAAPSPTATADDEPETAPTPGAGPGAVADAHAAAWRQLDVSSAEIRAGQVAVERGRADATLDVVLTLGGLGDWSYAVDVVLLRETGQWRVQWSPDVIHPELDPGERFVRRVAEVSRAPIVAHDGAALTSVGEVVQVGIEPRRVEDGERVVQAFEVHTGVDPEEVRELLGRDDLVPEWFYPVVTLRQDEFDEVEDLLFPVPGIVFRRTEARLTPTEDFARHVLGRTGEITADLLEQLGDPYTVGDVVGRSGLERVFERRLSGRPGAEIAIVRGDDDAAGQVVHEFDEQAPQPVETSLDVAVQTAVEAAIDGTEDPAALVAVDTATGGIRGVASRPLDEFNRALAGRYPPGSSFKIATTAAVLGRHGADVRVACPEEVVVGGLRIRNAHGLALGEIDLEEAFAQSCNTAYAALARDLDADDLEAAAATFGFGTSYSLPLDAAGGSFPEPDDVAERAAAAIGQGRVQASPLHMATVAAAVADGSWRPPHLLTDDVGTDARDLDGDVTSLLREFMRAVVERGTGTAADVAGDPVAGKTGSAEFGEPTDDGELPTHAWFVGYRGDLAFAVLVEGGGAGGEVAAPLAARFLEALDREQADG